MENKLIIAVDFDGTLCGHEYPSIGEPHLEVIATVKAFKAAGHSIVLWTCRENKRLLEAVDWCTSHHLTFDAINENSPWAQDLIPELGISKIFAHLYIDDKANSIVCDKQKMTDMCIALYREVEGCNPF